MKGPQLSQGPICSWKWGWGGAPFNDMHPLNYRWALITEREGGLIKAEIRFLMEGPQLRKGP